MSGLMIREKNDNNDNQYLSFLLGDEEYGINIADVIEIIGIQKITTIPEQPDYVNGVINLRGRIMSVIDVRTRFGKERIDYDERTCIIVVDISGTFVGFVVDCVNEVSAIQASDISQPPSNNLKSKGAYVKGIARKQDKMVVIIDGEMLIDMKEQKTIESINNEAS